MNVALYTRVSLEKQEENENPKAHLEYLRRHAAQQGYTITGEYVDQVFGWIPLDERPEGQRLLHDARLGRFTIVLVYKVDRMARTQAVLLKANEQLLAHGVTLKSATEPVDPSTPMGNFMFQLMGSMADLERQTIKERSLLGRRQKNLDGRWTQARVPYGYDVRDKQVIPSEHPADEAGTSESAIARSIFDWVASGLSCESVAARLTALGIPSVQRSSRKVRIDTPEWYGTRIARMIHNPFYRGTVTINSKTGPYARPVPALVDDETWEAANAAIVRTVHHWQRQHPHAAPPLLSGLARCACGFALTACSGNLLREDADPPVRSRYYKCTSRRAVGESSHGSPCANHLVPAEPVDALVWERLANLLAHPDERLEQARRAMLAQVTDPAVDEQAEEALRQRLAKRQGGRERLMRLVSDGLIDYAEATRQLKEAATASAADQMALDTIQAQRRLVAAQVDGFIQAAQSLRAIGATAVGCTDPVERQEIARLLIREVTIANPAGIPELRIRWALPQPPDVLDMQSCRRLATQNISWWEVCGARPASGPTLQRAGRLLVCA